MTKNYKTFYSILLTGEPQEERIKITTITPGIEGPIPKIGFQKVL